MTSSSDLAGGRDGMIGAIRMKVVAAVAGAVTFAGCGAEVPLMSEAPTATRFANDARGHPVLVGAGDIAVCGSSNHEATARLLDAVPGTVFTTGDNAYGDGDAAEFDCYDQSWGRHRDRTRPTPGNHDYGTRGAEGYFDYFGTRAGPPGRGYYSYDIEGWHIVALNSNCDDVGGCHRGSPQERWLRADLAASAAQCTAAYWHHPLFTSGKHAPATEMRPIMRALYDHDAEIVIAGHNHNYERFAPMDSDGRRDDARGIRTFVAGTGGKSHYSFTRIHPHSEARNADTFGVLAFVLKADEYEWEFIPVPSQEFTDTGSGRCH